MTADVTGLLSLKHLPETDRVDVLAAVFRAVLGAATEAFAEIQPVPDASEGAVLALAELSRGVGPGEHVADLLPALRRDPAAAALACAASAHAEVWQGRKQLVSAREACSELWISLTQDQAANTRVGLTAELSELLKVLS